MNKLSYTPPTSPLLTAILDKLPNITKCKRAFFTEIFTLILSIGGRLNYKNMARYGSYSQHTYSRNYKTLNFDHLFFNTILIQTEVQGKKTAYIDATFVSKSGKFTFGIGDFWDGSQGRAHSGLELSLISVVNFHTNGNVHTAWPLSARQTPDKVTLSGKTRNQWYGEHIQLCIPSLKELEIKHFGGDTAYTNKEIVDIVCENELDFVGKLRKDANLMYLYEGEKKLGKGRPQKYEGKVDFKDFSKWTKKDILAVNEEKTTMQCETLYDKVVWHKSLKRKIKAVVLMTGKGKPLIFFSTDLMLTSEEIVKSYRARFQMEYNFRDAKQFLHLDENQAYSPEALDTHFNTVFSALNLAKSQIKNKDVISISDVKTENMNCFFLNLILSKLEIEVDINLISQTYEFVRNFAKKAA